MYVAIKSIKCVKINIKCLDFLSWNPLNLECTGLCWNPILNISGYCKPLSFLGRLSLEMSIPGPPLPHKVEWGVSRGWQTELNILPR